MYRDYVKEHGHYYSVSCWGYIGIMAKNMETTVVYWGYIGIMEKNVDTTIVYRGYV